MVGGTSLRKSVIRFSELIGEIGGGNEFGVSNHSRASDGREPSQEKCGADSSIIYDSNVTGILDSCVGEKPENLA